MRWNDADPRCSLPPERVVAASVYAAERERVLAREWISR
jgi:hypothetical protein